MADTAPQPQFDPSNGISTPQRAADTRAIDVMFHEARIKYFESVKVRETDPLAAEKAAEHRKHLQALGVRDPFGPKSAKEYERDALNSVSDGLHVAANRGFDVDRSDDSLKASRDQAASTLEKLQAPPRFVRIHAQAFDAASKANSFTDENELTVYTVEQDRIATQVIGRGDETIAKRRVDDALNILASKDKDFTNDIRQSGALSSASFRLTVVHLAEAIKNGEGARSNV